MNAISVPSTMEVRRRRLFGLILAVAAVTAASTWALVSALDTGTKSTRTTLSARTAVLQSLSPEARRYVQSIMALTPAQLAAGAGGLTSGRTLSPDDRPYSRAASTKISLSRSAAVLQSLSPEARRYVQSIMALTPAQLAAGAGGLTSGRTLSPDDRPYSRGMSFEGTVSPDDRPFARGTSFESKGGQASQTPTVRPDVRAIRALTRLELATR